MGSDKVVKCPQGTFIIILMEHAWILLQLAIISSENMPILILTFYCIFDQTACFEIFALFFCSQLTSIHASGHKVRQNIMLVGTCGRGCSLHGGEEAKEAVIGR
jgi:hypothetical protein